MTQVGWISLTKPSSLVNIATDAIAMQCENVVMCIDIVTRVKSYYKADSPETGASIAIVTGHNRLPLFGFAEGVLQPRIFIVKYPELTPIIVLSAFGVTKFVDLKFSEHGHIIGLTGSPHYTFHIWNYRLNSYYCGQDTNLQCAEYSTICSNNNLPVIVNFSSMTRELFVWELCMTTERYFLHCRSSTTLSRNYEKSCGHNHMTFADDGSIYIIDDFGYLFYFDVGQFYLQEQFAIPKSDISACRHSLYYCKNGLLVTTAKAMHYIKLIDDKWVVEWTIDNMPADIVKVIYNHSNEIFASNSIGNVYRVEIVNNKRIIKPFSFQNVKVISYAVGLKGIREELIVLLSNAGEIIAMDMAHVETFSVMNYPNSKIIAGHNLSPYIIVGLESGALYFISYEKVRAPVQIGVFNALMCDIQSILYFETCAFVLDSTQEHHIIRVDMKKAVFSSSGIIPKIPVNEATILVEFLIDFNRALVCLSDDFDASIRFTKELRMYNWISKQEEIILTAYDLPHNYRSIFCSTVSDKKRVELFGIREFGAVIDVFKLNDTKQLIFSETIATTHLTNIIGISGTRNLITWGVDAMIFHFKAHKRHNDPLMIAKTVVLTYVPYYIKSATECFTGKYIIVLYSNGNLKIYYFALKSEPFLENNLMGGESIEIVPKYVTSTHFGESDIKAIKPLTDEQKYLITKVQRKLIEIKKDVAKLIEYDISVTGKTQGVYRKFCLNRKWLATVEEQWRMLCAYHRKVLQDAVNDKTRIRDWILKLVTSTTSQIGYKLRAIFSNTYLECYSIHSLDDYFHKLFDLFYLYDADIMEQDDENEEENKPEGETNEGMPRSRNFFVVKGNIFEHCDSPDFRMEDKDLVTQYQMHNHYAKFKALISNQLRKDFNKKFYELEKFKKETIEEVKGINLILEKIHSNMNCMHELLGMDKFVPEPLSVPEWQDDEVLDRVMTVDDSEVKAINRRKKKAEIVEFKSGRMLLWADEFWTRALMTMMDGVLEKLWEEEIKKDIPIPEFMLKKDPHEFSLEEQRQVRDYEERLVVLESDRRKYLRILHADKAKTIKIKDSIILRFNEKLNRLAIVKLQYDFHLKVGRLRDLNLKIYNQERKHIRTTISALTDQIETLDDYIQNYANLKNFWGKSVSDLQTQMDNLHIRDKTLERSFRNNFVGSLHPAISHDILKLYRKRPKVQTKPFNTTLACLETASRIPSKKGSNFPLPRDILDYLANLEALDSSDHCPHQVDNRSWDQFVKLRRLKIEMELRLKGVGFRLSDAQNALNTFTRDYSNLLIKKQDYEEELVYQIEAYTEVTRNKAVVVVLNQGQVEVNLNNALVDTINFVLLNRQDLHDVNDLIRNAGEMKIKSMERVAIFRRKVKHEEWEHRMLKLEMLRLKHKLYLVKRAKVTKEGLALIRNWEKAKKAGQKMRKTPGLINRIMQLKDKAISRRYDEVLTKVKRVEQQILHKEIECKHLDRKISAVQVDITYANVERDLDFEKRRERFRKDRLEQIMKHKKLIDTVRNNHAKILELTTLLELQRLRTYPTLGPAPEC
ncbi:uncharacterized protein LOC119679788 [Teleopsis dalmanni]|uniref:uncharacterized protein LOC119679788 n=1 Tax=Teleopsis dalmanni TaxID=139649 RepID=UPI0018CFE0CE|nr:uncharacterized protein LOC119679788 [Teleopsis dalmanni]